MFGFEFLFGYALLALPLAGLPVLLHLLFRRKSPLVYFSTLRFIKSSVQRTAARKRVRRWLLLACRILLLTLLIWAVAQPARRLANWMGGQSIAAAIVVDTSYSMLLKQNQATLLSRANDSIDQLLRQDLKDARVAIFRSAGGDTPERFETAGAIEANWRPLQAQPAPTPLVDRVAAAEDLLRQQNADHKWLIVISDLQRREFPRPLPEFADGRTILIDLHPSDPWAAAITDVSPEPAQPRLGIAGRVAVGLVGRAEDSRAVSLSVATVQNPQTPIAQPNLPMARLDHAGRATLRVPLAFSAQSWLLLTASLQSSDALPWASSRTELVRVPTPAVAQALAIGPPNHLADAILRLALDPWQGAQPAWPITLRPPGSFQADDDLAAANLTSWPDEATARQWAQYATNGGTLVLFLQPGLEQSWPQLPTPQREMLLRLLPGTPTSPTEPEPFHGSLAKPDDRLLTDVGDKPDLASGRLVIERLVRFDVTDPAVDTILTAASDHPTQNSKLLPLLTHRPLGNGQVYVFSTLPTPLYGNLSTSYELFLPMLVNTAIRPQAETASLNVELGRRIVLPESAAPGAGPVVLIPPNGVAYQINPTTDQQGRQFISDPTNEAGLYTWKRGEKIVAYTNVQYPSEEADLEYRQANEIAVEGPTVMVARSVAEMQGKMQQASEPESHWSGPIAIVLFLLCLEALLGSVSKLWKPTKTGPVFGRYGESHELLETTDGAKQV